MRLAEAQMGAEPRKADVDADVRILNDMKRKATRALETLLKTPRIKQMKADNDATFKGFEKLMQGVITSGHPALSISQNDDKTFLCRTVGLTLGGLPELYCRDISPKLLESLKAIFNDLIIDALRGEKHKLEPGRKVFAQRFALKYELVEHDNELEWTCPIWVVLEAAMSAPIKAVELVVLEAEQWTKGKGVRFCAVCKKSDVECSLKVCVTCKTVKYCSKECQVRHWKQGHKTWCKQLAASAHSTA